MNEASMMSSTGRRLYYGWVICAVSFLTISVATAVRQGFIIFFPPLLQEFGWSRTVSSVAPALFGLVASVAGFFIGYLSDRIDIKRLIPLGALVSAAGLLLCTFTRHLWQIIVFYGVLAAAGAAALNILPHTIIISNWFIRHRGTAIGIISSGTGAGTLAFIPLLQLAMDRWGWRPSFAALAVLTGPLLIPVILLFQKSTPQQMGLQPLGGGSQLAAAGRPRLTRSADPAEGAGPTGSAGEGRARGFLLDLAGSRRFWTCFLQFVLGPLSTMPIIMHQAALLQDKGLSSMGSAWVVAIYGLAVFLGMILSGSLSDRVGREWSYSLGTLCILIGSLFLLLLPQGEGLGLPLLYAVFFGLGFGSRPPLDSATAADIFRGARFGTIYGILQLGLGIGLFCGPILGGVIYDRSGSYSLAILFCMVSVLAATLCIWLAAPRRGPETSVVGAVA